MSDPWKPPAQDLEVSPTVETPLRPRERLEFVGTGLAIALVSAAVLASTAWFLWRVRGAWSPQLVVLAALMVVVLWTSLARVRAGFSGKLRVPATKEAPTDPRIEAELAGGKRPREWSLTLDECVALAKAEGAGGLTVLLAASKALDEGAPGLAGELLSEGLDLAGEWHRETALLAAAHAALVDGDRERARALFREAGFDPTDGYGKLAESALLLAEGRASEAKEALRAFESHLAAAAQPAWTMHGNHWLLDEMRARLANA